MKSKYEYFPAIVIIVANLLDPTKKLSAWYIKCMSLLNYMFVCSIGVFINQTVLHATVTILGLFMANMLAIFVVFASNWTFTVGPYGFLFGFTTSVKEVARVLVYRARPRSQRNNRQHGRLYNLIPSSRS